MTTRQQQHPHSAAVIAAAAAAAAAAATALIVSYCHHRRGQEARAAAAARIAELEASVEKHKELRQSERNGRTRAEARLRELQLLAAAASATTAASEAADAPPADVPPPLLRPIGRVRSVFGGRNGTPRQPLRLAPSARAVLQLDAWVPAASLEGLDQYSHVWLIYAFHANTDAGKVSSAALVAPPPPSSPSGGGAAATTAGGDGDVDTNTNNSSARQNGAPCPSPPPPPPSFRAKIHVPRLDGRRVGVLATRSPHRPCPVGLSAARLLAVLPGGRLLLGGADLVDGTPVLDVKPYVPFCDAVEGAEAPNWVAAEATAGRGGEAEGGRGRSGENGSGDGNGPTPPMDGEPLRVSAVVLGDDARTQLHAAWEAVAGRARDGTRRGAVWRRPPPTPQQLRQQRDEGASRGSLYDSPWELERLVFEVLSRDIRSAHQRLRGKAAAAAAAAAEGAGGARGGAAAAGGAHATYGADDDGRWHVVLDGVDVSYAVDVEGRVVIRNAKRAAFGADGADGKGEGEGEGEGDDGAAS